MEALNPLINFLAIGEGVFKYFFAAISPSISNPNGKGVQTIMAAIY